MKDVAGIVLALAALYLSGMIGLLIGFCIGRYTDIKPWEEA